MLKCLGVLRLTVLLATLSTTIMHSDYRSHERASAAILNAAIGDALGRITEFIDTTAKIKENFGKAGVTVLKQAVTQHPVTHQQLAPYTDDTVMARILLKSMLEGRKNNRTLQEIMDDLARAYANLLGPDCYKIDCLYNLRAHGIRNMSSAQVLNERMQLGQDKENNWWLKRSNNPVVEAGCGSVMRAWPIGLVFPYDEQKCIDFAVAQSMITHTHPMASAASAAIAVGTAYAMQGKSVDEIVEAMIRAAEQFDIQEAQYKPFACKQKSDAALSASMIAHDELLTSDMIRYAYQAAQLKKTPEEILGTNNMKKQNHRSSQGFLLGWAADEAVAGAVYLFVRNNNDVQKAIIEGVNTPGDSDSLASLAGALAGAHTGIIYADTNIDLLEDKSGLLALAGNLTNL